MHVGGSVKKVGGGGKDSRSMRYHRSRSALMHMVEKTSGCDMAGRRSQWADVAVGGGTQELSVGDSVGGRISYIMAGSHAHGARAREYAAALLSSKNKR